MASDRPPPSRTKFYAFLGGDTRQWHPDLVYDNHAIEPPRTPEQGYQLSEDLADRAIEFSTDAKQMGPNKTFLSTLLPRRHPRPSPCGQAVGGPLSGPIRRRLGRQPGEGLCPPEKDRP